ncbi:MAG: alpha-L-fucosidase [Anaerolineales bacterium]|nr:alpha-L-fucosidase [Anaerolineales bacterium]
MREKILKNVEKVIAAGPFQDDWDSLANYPVPDWYQEGKFGIFIHWGPYSVPAFGNEWYPRNMYQEGTPEFKHHIATYGPQRKFGYKDFIPLFKASNFEPEIWADLFWKAGARFVVPVAEHHDGFQMYDSALSPWNAAKMGPKRDVIAELAGEVREKGLVFGFSNHRAEHHFFFDGGLQFESDVNDPRWADFYGPPHPAPGDLSDLEDAPPSKEHLDDWLARNCELVEKVQPQLVWFDWWIQNRAFIPYLKKFAAYYYNRAVSWNKQVAINFKHNAFPEGTAVFDIERGQLPGISPLFWQGDTSISKNSWGYIDGHDYKTAEDIICDLIDTVSKNGALLLNIGPRHDGTIPEPEQEILLEIGRWLAVNGEAIYGTKPWQVFGEGPTKIVAGSFNDTKRAPFNSEDIRFTRKGDTLYAMALKWPENGRLLIKSLAAGSVKINKIELLGDPCAPKWNLNQKGLALGITNCKPSLFPLTFKIS